MKNKKAQLIILKLMLGVIVFIIAFALAQPTKEVIDIQTNGSNLNCSSSTLTNVEDATCVTIEMGLFYFISVLIALSVGVVSGSRTFHGVISSIFVFMVIVMMISPLKDLIVLMRDASHLDCTNAAISTGAKMTCIVADLWLFYFVAVVIAGAVTAIFTKKVIIPRLEK